MSSNRIIKWGGALIFLLIVANILNQFYWNWGLITVKVHDAPLSKVIKSIEWQGWVKIYTNLSPDTKVSMYVDHVPLAEAMETLSANVGGPPMGADRPRDGGGNGPGGNPPPANPGAAPAPDVTGNNTNAPAGAPPAGPGAQGGPGGFAGGGPPGGGPGGGPGGRGGGRGGFGGFGGGATWNLGFFVAPTSAQVKAEIQAFESGTTDDDTRVYTYPTPLQMLATDSDMPVADPRRQIWPGYKAPDPAPPAPATPTTDGQAPAPAPVDDGPPTVQTYLQAFAQGSNIWIMTPGSWAPEAHAPPPASSSIISAVKNFVSSSNGAVTQAIVLRVGRGARGGGGFGNRGGGGGGFGDMSAMDDRMRNAINGLPADDQPQALDQLSKEVDFYKGVQAAAPEDRPKMIQDHMMQKLADTNPMGRMSPEKRASRMARSVSAREAVRGK